MQAVTPLPSNTDPDLEEAQTPANTAPELFSPDCEETYAAACREKEDLKRRFQEAIEYEHQDTQHTVAARNRKRVLPLRRVATTNKPWLRNPLLLPLQATQRMERPNQLLLTPKSHPLHHPTILYRVKIPSFNPSWRPCTQRANIGAP